MAMLGPFPQFDADVPSLLIHVSGVGGIAVKPRVASTDALLPRVGVIESAHVDDERYIAAPTRTSINMAYRILGKLDLRLPT